MDLTGGGHIAAIVGGGLSEHGHGEIIFWRVQQLYSRRHLRQRLELDVTSSER